VNRGEQLDGFDLDDDFVFHNQVGPETGVDSDIPIHHRNGLLTGAAESSLREFIAQNGIVYGFQQPGPEGGMHAKGSIHDLFRNGVFGHDWSFYNLSPRRQDAKNAFRGERLRLRA
jgi:hypothetical protein